MRSSSLLGIGLSAVLSLPVAAQIQVTSVFPTRNATDAATATAVAITFAEAIQPATVSAASVRVYGRWSGVTPGSLALTNSDRTITFTATRPFFAGELVTIMLSSAVTAVSTARLAGGHTWSFWARPNQGSRSFTLAATIPIRLPNEGPIQTYGAYAGDLDGDGSPDLSLPDEIASDVRVLRNDGCGNYLGNVPHALQSNGAPSTNEGQDFNGDGFIDLAVGDIAMGSVSILMGDGTGGYLPAVHYPSGRGTRGLTVLDADGDGDVDIVTANRTSSELALHLNNGDGTFAPATFFDGGGRNETAIAAADANGDGIADLFVGNYGSQTITILLGDGAGSFALSATIAVTGSPWMITTGDVDGDGFADAVTCNSSSPRVAIARGDGTGGFLGVSHYATGSFPLAIDLGDLDGDGALDIVASNYSGRSFTGRWNDGSGGFASSFTLAAPRAGSCAILADHDRDGDLDILGVDELADVVLIFRQVSVPPPGVQPLDCAAGLRIDSRAGHRGLGTLPPHDVTRDHRFFVGVQGGANRVFGLLAGLPTAPGIGIEFGVLNLDPSVLVNLATGTTDGFGEATVTLAFPSTLPAGIRLALQAGVMDPAHLGQVRLTNAETVVIR